MRLVRVNAWLCAAATAAGLWLAGAATASAADAIWVGGTSGDWATTANWSGTASTATNLWWNNASTGHLTSENQNIASLSISQLIFENAVTKNVSITTGNQITLGGTNPIWMTNAPPTSPGGGNVEIDVPLLLTNTGANVNFIAGTAGDTNARSLTVGGNVTLDHAGTGLVITPFDTGFSVTVSGVIGQTTATASSLNVTGGGSVYLTGANAFTGNVLINGAKSPTVYVNALAAYTVAQPLGKGVARYLMGTNPTLVFNGADSSKAGTNCLWVAAAANSTIANEGSVAMTLSGNINPGATASAVRLNLGGANAGNNTVSSVLADGTNPAGKLSLNKAGNGKWILSGANTYTGATTVSQGTLELASTGDIAGASVITVASSAAYQVDVSAAQYLKNRNLRSEMTGGSLNGLQASILNDNNVENGFAQNVTMSWRAKNSSDTGLGAMIASNVLDLTFSDTATGHVPVYVLQMAYDSDSLPVGVAPFIAWNNGGTWVNAGSGTELGAYDGSDLTVGHYGYSGATAWVVVNHASEFAVVPEPGTLALLATGLIGLLAYAWRKRK